MTDEVSIDLSRASAGTESVTDLLRVLASTLPEECTCCGSPAPATTSYVGTYQDPTGAPPWGYRLCSGCGEKVYAGDEAQRDVLRELEKRFLGETAAAGTA